MHRHFTSFLFLLTILPIGAPAYLLADELRLLTWNVESGGNNPDVIADQLAQLAPYDIFGLTEVHPDNTLRYTRAIQKAPGTYRHIVSSTGNEDRLMLVYDARRLMLLDTYELVAHDGTRLNSIDFRYRSPLVARFVETHSKTEFLLVLVHLARGKAEFRQEQAVGLRNWAAGQCLPIIGIGDFNYDFEFAAQRGNAAFDIFLESNVWKWVRPEKLVDTNWYDPEQDGQDNYPGSCLDFTFVAGPAKAWRAQSRVIERPGDFPDDDETSDHRPVELTVAMPHSVTYDSTP